MVRQNEAVDEEDEHFEDIIENDDEPKPATDNLEKEIQPVEDGHTAAVSGTNSSDDDDDDDIPASSDDDEASDADEDDFIVRGEPENIVESAKVPNPKSKQSSESLKKCGLPGGYNPRHREPSYCNADRTGWWELTVLASHAHPSVSNWANKLLLGCDIIYNGDPVKDLSLPAFLDKFMEKKPKSSAWHGGSQIEPAKKLEIGNHLIGPEILSLADEDVPPEDLVFHKFYMNKQGPSKKSKKKKKKKSASDEAAEELFGDGGDDESDNEEIENLLDSANLSAEPDDGEYDYDDLDKVAGEDDDDLVGNASDEEADLPSDVDIAGGEDFDFDLEENGAQNNRDGDIDEGDDDMINVGQADDDNDIDDREEQPKRKRKSGKSGASPFASLEEYEHLMNDDHGLDGNEPAEKKTKKSKSRKKKVIRVN